MTSDSKAPFFVKMPQGRRADSRVALALAVSAETSAAPKILSTQVSWSPRAAAIFSQLGDQAHDTKLPEGKTPPYASLRAALQVHVSSATLVSYDLGAPWKARDRQYPFLEMHGIPEGKIGSIQAAFATWFAMVFRPWAEDLDLDMDLADSLAAVVAADDGLVVSPGSSDLSTAFRPPIDERKAKYAIIQLLARRLEGAELFDGLGPVFRIARNRSDGNSLELMTWPIAAHDATYSMVARFTIESQPWSVTPIVTVTASIRRWMTALPGPNDLRGQRRVTGYMMSHTGASLAVEFSCDIRKGVPTAPFSPEYMLQALKVRADLTAPFDQLVTRGLSGGKIFVGVPYSPRYGTHPIKGSATTRDTIDLFDAASEILAPDGFAPIPFTTLGRAPIRNPDFHKVASFPMMLASVAQALGHNDISEKALADAYETLVSGGSPTGIDADEVVKAHAQLVEIQEANVSRVRRVRGTDKPTVILMARTEQERQVMRDCVTALFGNSIILAEEALPANVHGTRKHLPDADQKADRRFQARQEAWRPVADKLASSHSGCHVLIQAPRWYPGGPDDVVNKLAGRCALATQANANVQFLLPATAGTRGIEHYVIRVQAAVYDLLFGHSGLVSEVSGLVSSVFPDAVTRPRSIIGISVITQARQRRGGDGGKVCLATRVDVADGRTSGRVGWFEGGSMRWNADWQPFFEILKQVAKLQSATIGPNRQIEGNSYQSFVRAVVDATVADGERPLVLLDNTSAENLWPWLADERISGSVTIQGEGIETSASWSEARLVRVRTFRAGRIIERKSTSLKVLDGETGAETGSTVSRYAPTVTASTIRLGDGNGRHYWSTSGYVQQVQRGLSVYRALPTFSKPQEVPAAVATAVHGIKLVEGSRILTDTPYRIPNPIEITVATISPGDTADDIAQMVDSLRYGYGHTGSGTTLPAPLSFESKVRDYMSRFDLDEADREDEMDDGGAVELAEGTRDSELADVAVDETVPVPDADTEITEDIAVVVSRVALLASPIANPTSRLVEKLKYSTKLPGEPGSLGSAMTFPFGPPPVLRQRLALVRPATEWVEQPRSVITDAQSESAETVAMTSPAAGTDHIPMPEFLNREWVDANLSITNQGLRLIFAKRADIMGVCPHVVMPDERKLTRDELVDIACKDLTAPSVSLAIYSYVSKGTSKVEIFGRLRENFARMPYKPLRGILRQSDPDWMDRKLKAAMASGSSEASRIVRDFLVCLAIYGSSEVALRLAKLHKALAFLVPYLQWLSEQPPFFSVKPDPLRDAASGDDQKSDMDADEADQESDQMPEDEQTHEVIAASPLPPDDGAIHAVQTGEDVEKITSEWVDLTDAIAGIAQDFAAPSSDMVFALEVELARAKSLLVRFEAAQPRAIDATGVIGDVADFVALTRQCLSETKIPDDIEIPTINLVLPSDVDRVQQEIISGAVLVGMVTEAKASLAALWQLQDATRLNDIAAATQVLNQHAGAVIAHVHKVVGLLASVEASKPADRAIIQAIEPTPHADPAAPEHDEQSEPTAASVSAEAPRIFDAFNDIDLDASLTEDDKTWLADAAAALPVRFTSDFGPEQVVDPQAERLSAKLMSLVSEGEFGLAWHLLRAARSVMPDDPFPFFQAELAWLAIAGHTNHTLLHNSTFLETLIAETLEITLQVASCDNPMKSTRLLLLFASSLELAVLSQNRTIEQIVVNSFDGLDSVFKGEFFVLKEAVVQAVNSSFALTPALLRSVEDIASTKDDLERCRKAVGDKVAVFAKLNFPITAANRIRTELCGQEQPIGMLRIALERDDGVGEAIRFSETFSARDAAAKLISDVNTTVAREYVDGPMRDRLVGHVIELANLCSEYVDASNAVPARVGGQRKLIMEMQSNLRKGSEQALNAIDTWSDSAPPQDAQLADFALRAIQHLLDLVEGISSPPGLLDHLAALHGSLPLLSDLDYARSWLPSPYEPFAIMDSISSAEIPLLPQAPDERNRRFIEIVRSRLDRGSFVGARLALQMAPFKGIDPITVDILASQWDADCPVRRGALKASAEQATATVERLQRLGEGAKPEQIQSILSQLSRINPDTLPVQVDFQERTDVEEDEHILDFCSAQKVLDDIVALTNEMSVKPRQKITETINRLVQEEKLLPEGEASVRSLVERDDLVTARERLDLLESQGALTNYVPGENRRFNEFFCTPGEFNVPDSLAFPVGPEPSIISASIMTGTDQFPLLFSRIQPSRREDAKAILDRWKALRKSLLQDNSADTMLRQVQEFLDLVGFQAKIVSINNDLTKKSHHVYVGHLKLSIPSDADSMLLPDYGSWTDGNYRVCAMTKAPTDGEIDKLTDTSGNTPTIMLVTDVVSSDRRKQIAIASVSSHAARKTLIIDEAILYYALSEPEVRPLTLIECAQPFAFAQPYGDYGQRSGVPPEMFFGREQEYRRLLDPFGSCIVYGGRRLGKTALLKHLETKEDKPLEGIVVAYEDIVNLGGVERSTKIWHLVSLKLKAVFNNRPVVSRDAFDAGVRKWLAEDSRRRILLLLDEADRFINEDATKGFQEFRALQSLMDETKRRFKFVLAGLRNVTRLEKTENPPLKQIGTDPQRIGPLFGADLPFAEALIVRPLAALGYHFEHREAVWSILSHTNYYPVLAQIFCAALLEELRRDILLFKRINWTISDDLVHKVLDSPAVVSAIGQKFKPTITDLDPRYELITYVLAARNLLDQSAGRIDEGMTFAEIRDDAVAHWPNATNQLNRLSIIEDLLDEMEGLGVVRRTKASGDHFTLRSPAILAILGTRDQVTEKLAEFHTRNPEPEFEPRLMRRALSQTKQIELNQPSPLTYGQEHDILNEEVPVRLIFGNNLSDIDLVAPALEQAAQDPGEKRKWKVAVRNWASLQDMQTTLRSGREATSPQMYVCGSLVPWNPEWISEAQKMKAVREKQAMIVFVGGPAHAMRVVRDRRFTPLPATIKVTMLETWSGSAIAELAFALGITPKDLGDIVYRELGGFTRPIRRATRDLVSGKHSGKASVVETIVTRLTKAVEAQRRNIGLIEDIGILPPLDAVFRGTLKWSDGEKTSLQEIREVIEIEFPDGSAYTAEQVHQFGVLMGLLEASPALAGGAGDRQPFAINPLAMAFLKSDEVAA